MITENLGGLKIKAPVNKGFEEKKLGQTATSDLVRMNTNVKQDTSSSVLGPRTELNSQSSFFGTQGNQNQPKKSDAYPSIQSQSFPRMQSGPIVVEEKPKLTQNFQKQAQSFKTFQLHDDLQYRDKYGFQQDDVSLADAFSLEQIKFKDGQLPADQFQQASLQNRKLWVFTQRNNFLIKAELIDTNSIKGEISVVDDQMLRRAKIRKMFVSDSGMHCFMLADHELFYNHWSSDYVQKISVDTDHHGSGEISQQRSFKSIDILKYGDQNSNVYEVLLGSEDGYLILGTVETNPRNGTVEVFEPFKVVLETPEFSPILDIKITQVKNDFLTLAVSATSLYQFVGSGSLDEVFRSYKNNPKLIQEHTIVTSARNNNFKQMHVSTAQDLANRASIKDDQNQTAEKIVTVFDQSKLQLFYENGQVAGFGWLNDNQFCYGQYIDNQSNTSSSQYILKQKQLKNISYLKKEKDQPVEDELPASFAITLFHIVFMYSTNITVVSKISREIVYAKNFEPKRPLRACMLDLKANLFLVYCPKEQIMVASLKGEDQDAWKYYLKRNEFKKALANCRTGKQKAHVSSIIAEEHFNTGKYEQAARLYAESNLTFETVTLKFLQHNQQSFLEVYLQSILKMFDRDKKQYAPQRMLICTWVVQQKLQKINKMKPSIRTAVPESKIMIKRTVKILKDELWNFIKENGQDIDQDTIFQMLQSHGKIKECIKFAEAVGCFQKLIIHYINKGDFLKALEKIENIQDSEIQHAQMLKYASILIKKEPIEALKTLETERFWSINLSKLMPSLMGVPRHAISEAKAFVTNHCIGRLKNKDKTVRNMQFWLYAEQEESQEMISFLEREETRKSQGNPILFEVDYALDVCRRKVEAFQEDYEKETNKSAKFLKKIQIMKKAQIILYGILNLYSKAVKLALECRDVDIAIIYASKPQQAGVADAKVQKKLWMKIAKYLFNYQNPQSADSKLFNYSSTMITAQKNETNVEKALETLKKCNVLKVQDLLHLFPQDAKVEDMKQHLCQCLDDYEQKIKGLREQIERHSQSAEKLRNQKRSMRNKHITINPGQTCDICFGTVFDKEFFVFPCSHAFHRECVQVYLEEYKAKDPRVKSIMKVIDSAQGQISATRGMAQYIDSAGQQLSGGITASMMQKGNEIGSIEVKDSSLLSGITDMFKSVVSLKDDGTKAQEGINSQTRKILDKGQQDIIRKNLAMIDNVLKKECLFCGSILIDMIDNEIASSKDLEFADGGVQRLYGAAVQKNPSILQLVEDEWEIK